MQSIVQERGKVTFPKWTGERVYMRRFLKAEGLPSDLKRWQPTVDAMLDDVNADGPIYLMIDQGRIQAGATHRRPGVHIDGNWMPDLMCHGNPHPGHHPRPSPSPSPHVWWGELAEEALLLASDVSASAAYAGEFRGVPRDGGDCGHIDLHGLRRVRMEAGRTYAGNVSALHESLPVARDCIRTLVRLNVPGWSSH